MQQFTAIGNLTRDPELSQTKSGKSVCRFTIAVNRKYVGQSGERDNQGITRNTLDVIVEECEFISLRKNGNEN